MSRNSTAGRNSNRPILTYKWEIASVGQLHDASTMPLLTNQGANQGKLMKALADASPVDASPVTNGSHRSL